MLQCSNWPAFVQKRIEKLAKIQDICPPIVFFLAVISLILFLVKPSSYLISGICGICSIILLIIYCSARKKMNCWKNLVEKDTGQTHAIKTYYYEPIVQMQEEYDRWFVTKPRNKEEVQLRNDWLKMLQEEMKRKAQMIEKF